MGEKRGFAEPKVPRKRFENVLENLGLIFHKNAIKVVFEVVLVEIFRKL